MTPLKSPLFFSGAPLEPDYTPYMRAAIAEALAARDEGEVPVGALVIAPDGSVAARAHNRAITLSDPSAHAEILALRAAACGAGNYRLTGHILVSTIEPCVMCMGAAVHARVAVIVHGAPDPRWGAAGSLYAFQEDVRLNHRPLVVPGILLEECRALLQDFFRQKRRAAAGPETEHP
jgi:tRNA(adenine34) deaminase